jgi:hypothetical protein
VVLLQEKTEGGYGDGSIAARLVARFSVAVLASNQVGSKARDSKQLWYGDEEKREISLRKSEMLLRNRCCKRFLGRRQRTQSAMLMRPGHETDVLTEFPIRLERRASTAKNQHLC